MFNELLFAINITPIFIIEHIIQYNIDEADSIGFWLVLPIYFILTTILYTSVVYSILYVFHDFFEKK